MRSNDLAELPTGTVTFLFTDIEGSTRLWERQPEAMEAAARIAARVAKAVNAAVKPDGLNLIQANGAGAGQSVAHFHLHVFPRRINDGVAINWDPKPGDMAHIGQIAERIRGFL